MKLKKLFRTISADEVKLDEEKRTITFPFSSELPVERWFGNEVLSHAKGAADLSRLNKGGALLWNHDTDQMIGCVDEADISADKRGYCTVRFADTPAANEKMGMVKDGILKNVSFGYQINEMELTKSEKGKPDLYTATKWMPFEVSFVSVPADPSVGVGRSENDEEEIEVKIINKKSKGAPMPEVNITDPAPVKETKIDAAALRTDAIQEERVRISAITGLGTQFKQEDLARQFVNSGKSLEDFRAAVLEKMGAVQKPINSGTESDLGLTEKESRQFSFLRICNALANPTDRKAQEAAKFEREISEAEAKRSGKTPRGFLVPTDVLRAKMTGQRDMTAGTSSAGGYSVATELDSQSFIELLRNKMVMQRLGCKVLNGLSSNISIPKLASASTAYWVAENSALTESAPALGQVAMSPKTVGGFVDISRRLLIQSDLSVDNLVKEDLAQVIGLAIDAKALYGDGSSNTITGLRSATGLNTVDFANSDPTWPEIVDMETQISADNADVASMKYIVNAQGRGKLKSTLVTATYGDRMIWGSDNLVNGYNVEVSNQVSKLSSVDYDYWFGDFSQAILGFFSGLDVLVDPYTGGTAGTVRIIAMQDVDFAVRHGESFCYGNKTIS
jgi:HK97 family phage major capsid protein/HK97 family phage prohead protease